MAEFFDHLNDRVKKFISEQHIFFVSTAPDNGRINLSPKGMDSFRVLGDNKIAFLNLTGSGNETAAHLVQNSRMTVMFCSFTASPLILRLYGHGKAVHEYDEEWDDMIVLFPPLVGARQIILMDVESVQTSCGYAVPRMDFREERQTLVQWTENKSEEELQTYWEKKNTTSIDGDPTYLLEKQD